MASDIPQGTTPRILLVDDDESVIFSTSTLLRVSGFAQVESLTDSRDVLGFC